MRPLATRTHAPVRSRHDRHARLTTVVTTVLQLPVNFRWERDLAPFDVMRHGWAGPSNVQFFAGGDGSGATMHFHPAAYNVLFFGVARAGVHMGTCGHAANAQTG